ncbi:hypothetical protein D3C85_281150 [compost metagenome]
MRLKITEKGANGLEVGTIVEAETIPAWLVNKCVVLEDEPKRQLEVSTPSRGPGRPKKQED